MRTTPALGLALLLSASPISAQSSSDGWVPLFNGRDLSGWKVPVGDGGHWRVVNGVIDYDALSEAEGDKNLWSERSFRDFQLRFEWRLKSYSGMWPMKEILQDGTYLKDENGNEVVTERPNVDSGVYLRGTSKAQLNLWAWPIGSGEVYGYRNDKSMPPEVRAGVTPRINADRAIGEWNTTEVTMKGDRLTVVINGETVIENAQLPGIPAEGPIALQHHGGIRDGKMVGSSSLVQFRNIYVREF